MPRHFALIPAAGSGSRIGGAAPKQYLPLAGRPLLYHAIKRICAAAEIDRVYVVLAPGDADFGRYDWTEFGARLKPAYCGGATRAASVLNGLESARDEAAGEDWVLVHDAARPCLGAAELARLLAELRDDEVGGLLALPLADTLKRAKDARVEATLPRDSLWRAQTPQMFRYATLLAALRAPSRTEVTDEASAVERLGLRPRLVTGSSANIKVTFPEDLRLAAAILENMGTA